MASAPDTTESDASIVARITGGDIDAYGELMARYEPKLHRYVTYLIHDEMAAHDVVQETFIRTYQNLRGFNPAYKFSSWIYRIAHNQAMNAVKKFRHHDGDIDELPDTAYDAALDASFDAALLRGHVQQCLDELDPKYRAVVHLIYFEHMKYDEVSDILHVPTSTVGVWLSRAKTRLKHICEQKGVTL